MLVRAPAPAQLPTAVIRMQPQHELQNHLVHSNCQHIGLSSCVHVRLLATLTKTWKGSQVWTESLQNSVVSADIIISS
jgi:hypothetical protein